MDSQIEALYDSPLPSLRTGLFYNTYAYPTKIAPESIAVYIAAHTKPGETVLDAFSGSGATGLAALMCEHPTDDMKRMADSLGISPVWGPRNASLYDISTYGTFAAATMTNPPDAADFKAAANDLIRKAEAEYGWMYKTIDSDGRDGTIRHVIWSSLLRCPSCEQEFAFYEGMVRWNPLRIADFGTCPHCGVQVRSRDCAPVSETVWDSLIGSEITRRKRVPVLVYGDTLGKNWKRTANTADFELLEKLEQLPYPDNDEPKPIEWGELHRSGYHQGITHLHHFYTKRNYIVMSSLWRMTADYSPKVGNALKLLLLSYNETHSTLMTRVVAKRASKDFVLTGAQSGVLYVSNLPVEKNILKGLKRKVGPFTRAFCYVNSCSGKVEVHNCSSTHMKEEDGSVSYVFTDPPFGDFIPYAEVNQINELWLGDVTDRSSEAIISPSQGKGVNDYGHILADTLSEIRRVLEDGRGATLVFHSSKAVVWEALTQAIESSGLDISATSHLAKVQQSFKQVVSPSSVRNDSLILLRKNNDTESMGGKSNHEDFVTSSNDPRDVYADYINYCLNNSLPVKLDAREAYRLFASRT